MSKSPLEETVEDYLVKQVEAIGGVALKGDVKGRRFLDRICILPGGVTVYVEVKRPTGGRYSKHQVETLKRLQALGHRVACVENRAEVDGFISVAYPAPSVSLRVRLPPIGNELYEHYPAMSAQTHADLVKDYARQAIRAALAVKGSAVTNHGSKSDLHPEYVTTADGTDHGYKSTLHPGNVPTGGDE